MINSAITIKFVINVTSIGLKPVCKRVYKCIPSKHETLFNAGLMLARGLRRWPNIKPALGERLLFVG